MKKQVIATLTIIFIILGMMTSVNAVEDATATLKSSKQELVPEEEFTVTFNAICEKGINGIMTTISYDEDKLELVKGITIVDTTKWVKLDGETELSADILANSSGEKITSGDVFTLTFKVKGNVRNPEKQLKLLQITYLLIVMKKEVMN